MPALLARKFCQILLANVWTTGSLAGVRVARYLELAGTLKAARPELQIVAAEPEQAALLSGGEWSPHKIQGWTPDFHSRQYWTKTSPIKLSL